jgi:hypothetical protein
LRWTPDKYGSQYYRKEKKVSMIDGVEFKKSESKIKPASMIDDIIKSTLQ